jgi:alpha/beta superfamily hydrolase
VKRSPEAVSPDDRSLLSECTSRPGFATDLTEIKPLATFGVALGGFVSDETNLGELRKLWIDGPAGRLEAALRTACPARAAAVVAHPHPEHGGTLHNPVVFHADRELHRSGFTTLRFNFRGVGSSEGAYDGGPGEVDDVGAAVSWLRGVALDLPLFLVGFSFGAACSVRYAVRDDIVAAVIAIGLPVGRYPIPELSQLARPLAVVQADNDEFGSLEQVRQALTDTRPEGRLYVVDGTTHLFPQRAPDAALQVVRGAEAILEGMQP